MLKMYYEIWGTITYLWHYGTTDIYEIKIRSLGNKNKNKHLTNLLSGMNMQQGQEKGHMTRKLNINIKNDKI